ncbi:hypothetical protein GOP47_0010801 [Adiantum capillus-veneris]|uniref:Acireductone dioxygenase n=1 Tax=Adiantum capillus-veneris TaxID=13818 RepID=A0A9D4ZG26_ADICA|nr:hypothetical protein GOP47_0010085 [Adiantum capillus-veneris]KAI5074840.1 hypothetical protein GOP47_0010801 [Adiantum capillus-veneris]
MEKLEAWEFHESKDDQSADHRHSPNRPIPWEHLKDLGVICWKMDVESKATLEKMKQERGYHYSETVTVAPGVLEGYEERTRQFYEEHLHPYPESRLVLDGSGYWDVRDYDGKWIRFHVQKGHLIVLPPGMYHRFTLDHKGYIQALLLYSSYPKRIEVLRPFGDDLQARKDYVKTILTKVHSKEICKC